ncbi:hypothetical protein [Sphingobacterium endophyticum]|uniref:hypothetical protein n=1 Tax=Sphingobacterium endophyticum TaxID=2546448 RepID=UPI0012E0DFC6|nr:hypothetical protein [Sphingobacterium endophyticum]
MSQGFWLLLPLKSNIYLPSCFSRVLVVNGPHLARKLSTARPLASGRAPDNFWTSCGRDTSKTRPKPNLNTTKIQADNS